MDIEHIKALAEIAKIYSLSSLEVRDGETKIKIDCSSSPPVSAPPHSVAPPPISEVSNMDSSIPNAVKSPLVGVCYTADAPDAEPFVSVGSKVKRGDVLCIIETMKLMNEVTAEQDGEITEVYIENGEIVEFGQVLFKFI